MSDQTDLTADEGQSKPEVLPETIDWCLREVEGLLDASEDRFSCGDASDAEAYQLLAQQRILWLLRLHRSFEEGRSGKK